MNIFVGCACSRNLKTRLRFHLVRFRVTCFPSYNLSHSQFGEDMVVRGLLPCLKNGVYVDIGVHHPIFYSNTYHFYLRGWRGLNVDATPGSMEAFHLLRPGDINVEACVSMQEGQSLEFYLFEQSAYNTADPQGRRRVSKNPRR